jgi:hypothetical protein
MSIPGTDIYLFHSKAVDLFASRSGGNNGMGRSIIAVRTRWHGGPKKVTQKQKSNRRFANSVLSGQDVVSRSGTSILYPLPSDKAGSKAKARLVLRPKTSKAIRGRNRHLKQRLELKISANTSTGRPDTPLRTASRRAVKPATTSRLIAPLNGATEIQIWALVMFGETYEKARRVSNAEAVRKIESYMRRRNVSFALKQQVKIGALRAQELTK